jgi:hypothetical protein
MPPALGHNLDTAKGNLAPEEREAVQVDNILGPSEYVLYAFCTNDESRTSDHVEGEFGKILFTSQRILYYQRYSIRMNEAFMYPYSALVSMTFPLIETNVRVYDGLASLKFRDVDCHRHSYHSEYLWIHVKLSCPEDAQHLSAATACMDRVPRGREYHF